MLSTATFESAQTRTGFTPSACTQRRTTSTASDVFPVPGGPCTSVSRRSRHAAAASSTATSHVRQRLCPSHSPHRPRLACHESIGAPTDERPSSIVEIGLNGANAYSWYDVSTTTVATRPPDVDHSTVGCVDGSSLMIDVTGELKSMSTSCMSVPAANVTLNAKPDGYVSPLPVRSPIAGTALR